MTFFLSGVLRVLLWRQEAFWSPPWSGEETDAAYGLLVTSSPASCRAPLLVLSAATSRLSPTEQPAELLWLQESFRIFQGNKGHRWGKSWQDSVEMQKQSLEPFCAKWLLVTVRMLLGNFLQLRGREPVEGFCVCLDALTKMEMRRFLRAPSSLCDIKNGSDADAVFPEVSSITLTVMLRASGVELCVCGAYSAAVPSQSSHVCVGAVWIPRRLALHPPTTRQSGAL